MFSCTVLRMLMCMQVCTYICVALYCNSGCATQRAHLIIHHLVKYQFIHHLALDDQCILQGVYTQIPVCICMYTQVHVAEPDLKKQGVPCQLPFGQAVLNDSNNVQWEVSVGADQELELRLVYTVEHPPQDAIEWA